MRLFVLAVTILCAGWQTAQAGVNSYQCLVKEYLSLDNNGALTRPPNPWPIGKRFSIDRNTGALVGPEQTLWSTASSKYTVLARGNASNSFSVFITDPAAENGMHTTLIKVEEYSSGQTKPFVLLSSSEVASGTCE